MPASLLPLLLVALLALLGVGVWALLAGRAPRRAPETGVSAQQLAALAQPFRRQIGEALEVQRDVAQHAVDAPHGLDAELRELSQRIALLLERAYPRARHGTKLAAYLLTLGADDPHRPETEAALARVEAELESFVTTFKALRGTVYQVLTNATSLGRDRTLGHDLDDVLIEVAALEEALRDSEREVEAL